MKRIVLSVCAAVAAAVFAVSARAELTVGSLTSGEDASVREIALPYGARAVVFTNAAGPLTFTVNGNWNLLRALVVGGGGSGGCRQGGGGGAGGYIELDYRAEPIACPDGTAFALQVGAGGSRKSGQTQGATGGTSTLEITNVTYTALGGGGGGCYNNSNNTTTPCASSGGGNNTSGYSGVMAQEEPGLAFKGGASSSHDRGGGGGGAGGPGTKNDTGSNGHGGPGRYSDITGELRLYAAGGGGKTGNAGGYTAGAGGAIGTDAMNGTGSGGGGGDNGTGGHSGAGGSGTVILVFEKDSDQKFELDPVPDATYGASGPLPAVTVRDKSSHVALTEGTDYTLSYSFGLRFGEATLYVKGKGAIYGTSGCSRTYRFHTTHVWTGADADAPRDFFSAANWSDAEGNPVVAAPGPSDSVFIGPVAAAAASVLATNAFDVAGLFIGARTNETYGGTLTVQHQATNTVVGQVVLYSKGVLTQTAQPSTVTSLATEKKGYKLNLSVGGDMTLFSGASVTVTGKGFATNQGPGAGGNRSERGASHGGRSLAAKSGETTMTLGKQTYGSVYYPVNLGSGGFWSAGGGAMHLHVGGTISIDGSVVADGTSSELGGSGGSILLEAGRIIGSVSGAISASGLGGSGGGGRIALHQSVATDFSGYTGTIRVKAPGGTNVRMPGCGTIYRRCAGQTLAQGELIIDNDGVQTGTHGIAEVPLDESAFGKVTIRNCGRLHLQKGQVLKVAGDWACGAEGSNCSVNSEEGSGVDFLSSAHHRVSGATTTLAGLVCTNAVGGALEFTSGVQVEIMNKGLLTLSGTTDSYLDLACPEGLWNLKIGDDVSASVRYVAASNSDARAGISVLAISSRDNGGNHNWSFTGEISAGDPLTWNGLVSDDWFAPENWTDKDDGHRAPQPLDNISIPSGCPNMPRIASGTALTDKLTVESGATLTLDGGNLVNGSSLRVAGSLVCRGAEKVTCSNTVDLADGSFVCARSAFWLVGDLSQTVNLNGQTFSSISIEKNGGSVSFGNGFTAGLFKVRTLDPFSIAFAAEKAVAVGDFFLLGAITNVASLTLASSVPGSAWLLNVSGNQFVTGVNVSDSDASGGDEVKADAISSAIGENVKNWTFAGASRVWTGAKNTSFTEAANWSPSGAPSADESAFISSGGAAKSISIGATTVGAIFLDAQEGSLAVTISGKVSLAGDFQTVGAVTMEFTAAASAISSGGSVLFGKGTTVLHSGSAQKPVAKVSISATNSVVIEAGAVIDVTGKGYTAGCGPGKTQGAGYPGTGHASRGNFVHADCGKTYGSILNPVQWGSGGFQNAGGGGGVVRIEAGGEVAVEGSIVADAKHNVDRSSAGGSVWITCGKLSGSGPITADGGRSTGNHAGSGGRISIEETCADDFAAFTGIIRATCDTRNTSIAAGPGTIRLKAKTVDEIRAGNLLALSATSYTDFPMPDDGDAAKVYRDTALVGVTNMTFWLTADATVFDLDLRDKTTKINLNGHTLTVRSSAHKKGKGWGDKYAKLVTENGGKIVWKGGMALIIR